MASETCETTTTTFSLPIHLKRNTEPREQICNDLKKWTAHLASKISNPSSIAETAHDSISESSTHHNENQQSQLEDAAKSVKFHTNRLLELSAGSEDPDDADVLLYRIHTENTKSPYDAELGIRCSGWTDWLGTGMVTRDHYRDHRIGTADPELGIRCSGGTDWLGIGVVTRDHYRDHMMRTASPSPYISVHKSPSRIINLMYNKSTDDTTVFVISTNRLKKLGIEPLSTVDLSLKFKLDRNDARYATDSHQLIQDCIPADAILGAMDYETFKDVAERSGIDINARYQKDAAHAIRINEALLVEKGIIPARPQARTVGESILSVPSVPITVSSSISAATTNDHDENGMEELSSGLTRLTVGK